jgi:hypothetical protein
MDRPSAKLSLLVGMTSFEAFVSAIVTVCAAFEMNLRGELQLKHVCMIGNKTQRVVICQGSRVEQLLMQAFIGFCWCCKSEMNRRTVIYIYYSKKTSQFKLQCYGQQS